MTEMTKTLDLIEDLPVLLAPDHPFADLYTLVPELLDLHPDWTVADVKEFVEEKIRKPLHPEDQTTLNALHPRCQRLRREFEG